MCENRPRRVFRHPPNRLVLQEWAVIDIHVINHDRAARAHVRPYPSQLKQHVLGRMQAVMDEQVNRPGGAQQSW